MQPDATRTLYLKRKEEFSITLAEVKKNINLVSNLRLFAALVIIILVYFSFQNTAWLYAVAGLIVLFLFLVKKHALLFDKKVHLENLITINKNEERIIRGEFSHLSEGRNFIDPHHPYSHDLDIFGEGSLFQYINRCTTLGGEKKFADALLQPLPSPSSIIENQDAIKDMAPRIDFRQNFQAAGMEAGEQPGDNEQLLEWVEQPSFLKAKRTLRIILTIIPALTIVSLIGAFFEPLFKIPLFSLILTQWILTAVYLKRINAFHDYISRKKTILEKYSRLLYFLEKEPFSSTKLKNLSGHAHEAHEKVNQFASLVGALDARTNSLATIFVNSFLLYDLQCVYRLEEWKTKNKTKLPVWLNAITEVEVLNSFATYSYNNTSFSYAIISDTLSIEAQDMAHPLLLANERVANAFSMGPSPSVLIITGANMAGKSTFLRTLGINLVLALNGAPVCATEFKCPIISLRSGMRTADSLKDHQSYFFAELNRLKSIMDELRSGRPLLILLDEILKGTNSNDKQTGSIALVKQLLPYPCLAIIATHDLALGELQLEFPDKVKNYCFEANIENDQLSFDYKLKEGLAQKMNASFLMRKMGIIPA